MSEFLIDPAELAPFMANKPGLLLLGESPGFDALGLPLWFGRNAGKDRFLISKLNTECDAVALPAPSIGIIAVLAEKATSFAPWRKWFASHFGAQIPEFLITHDPLTNSAIVKALLLRQDRAIVTASDLQWELLQLRRDLEQTQAATAGFVRALSYRPPAPMQLQSAVDLGSACVRLDADHPWLIQPLGTRLDKIGAIEIFIAESQLSPSDHLRVRLSGIESGRVSGSWLLPAEALKPGWLALELPSPAGWAPQTAQLEFHLSTQEAGTLDLGVSAADGHATNRARRVAQEFLPHELALKIWLAERAGRFVAAAYWDGAELGIATHPAGAALAMPMHAYAHLRVAGGRLAQAYDPSMTAPLVLEARGGQQTLLIFPLVLVAGMDVVEAVLGLRTGDLRQLTAALWLQPAGRTIESEDDLLLCGSSVAWTGWFGWGGRGDLKLSLEIPAESGPTAQLVLAIDHVIRRKAAIALIELRRASLFAINPGHRARRVQTLIADGSEPAPKPVEFSDQFWRDPAHITLKQVILDEHFDNQSSYRHLDMRVSDLTVDEFGWPFVKFRLVVENGRPCLEFRDIPSWPRSLRHWPFETSDQFGRIARFFGDAQESELLKAEAPLEDLALIHGLAQSLPGIAAKAVTLAAITHADAEQWIEDAGTLTARLSKIADLLLDR